MALSYYEQLHHPLWKRKRTEILKRDNYKCRVCGSSLHKLEVHHLCYFPDLLVWEYESELMVTVCKKHHLQLTYDTPKIAGLLAFLMLLKGFDINTFEQILNQMKPKREQSSNINELLNDNRHGNI